MIRFDRLDLKRIGNFDDKALHFDPNHSVHVILGENEAGKSTLLRGVSNLFYGFPQREADRDAYGARGKQSIGASLREGGTHFTLTREPKQKQSLAAEPNLPQLFDAKTLTPKGFRERDQFTALLGMDQPSLRAGGELIMQGEQGVGAALFAAGTGIDDIEARINALRDECEALFPASGRPSKSARIWIKTVALEDARKELKQSELLYSDQDSFNESQTQRQAAIERIDAQLAALRAAEKQLSERASRRNELARLDARLNPLAETAQAADQRAQEAWGEAGLPDDHRAVHRIKIAVEALASKAADLDKAETRRQALQANSAPEDTERGYHSELLALDALDDGEAMARLAQDAADSLARIDQQLARALDPLGVHPDQLRHPLPDAEDVADLLTARSELIATSDALKRERASLDDAIERLAAELEEQRDAAADLDRQIAERDNLRQARNERLSQLISARSPKEAEPAAPGKLAERLVEIDRLARDADQAADSLALNQQTLTERKRRDQELKALEKTRAELTVRAEETRVARDDLRLRWQALWQQADLPVVDGESYSSFVSNWQQAKELNAQRAQAAEALSQADARVETLWQALSTIARRLGEDLPVELSAMLEVDASPTALATAWRTLDRWRRAEDQRLAAQNEQRQALDQETKTVHELLDSWNSEAQSLDLPKRPSATQASLASAQLQQACAQASAALKAQSDLAATVRERADTQAALDELPASSGQAEDLSTEIDRLEAERNALQTEQSLEKSDFERKLNAREPAQLRARMQRLTDELREMVDLYATKLAAKDMLEAALKRASLSGNDDFLAAASSYFEQLTAGRYNQLLVEAPGIAGWLAYNAAQQLEVPVTKLSAGTHDQLFLALRLAFLDKQAPMHRLPMVLDDALTDFDDRRAANAFGIFGQLKDRQVLYFTHHPTTAELAAEHGNAEIIRL